MLTFNSIGKQISINNLVSIDKKNMMFLFFENFHLFLRISCNFIMYIIICLVGKYLNTQINSLYKIIITFPLWIIFTRAIDNEELDCLAN